MLTKIVSLIALFFCAVSTAFGQESGKTTFFSSSDACISAPASTVNEYQPVFSDNLAKWQALVQEGKAELVQGHGKTYCVEEWSMEGQTPGKHIIRWPTNNPYFKGADGKIADGRCGNWVAKLWEVPQAPVPPPPPVYVPPTPVAPPTYPPPPPVKVSIPVGPPACVVNGTLETGLTGTAYNGKGIWVFYENGAKGLFVYDGSTFTAPTDLGPGSYRAVYEVSGQGGQKADCERAWEISIPVVPEEVPVPEAGPGFCESGHNWFVTATGVQVRCHPVRTAIVAVAVGGCVTEIVISHGAGAFLPPCGLFSKKPVLVGTKPPVTVISPAARQPVAVAQIIPQ